MKHRERRTTYLELGLPQEARVVTVFLPTLETILTHTDICWILFFFTFGNLKFGVVSSGI